MALQILVTDDDRRIQRLISDCLEIQGYNVILASNGIEALQLAQKYHPHLLISDIKMPYKDGYDLVKELRQIPQFRLLPVIFLTHQDSVGAKIHGYQAGCDIYLAKPFQTIELIAIVKNLLERSQVIQSELIFSQDYTKRENEIEINLTPREVEVLKLLMDGFSNHKIADTLYLSPKTIEKYVANLLQKTGAGNRTELVSFAFKNHLLNS